MSMSDPWNLRIGYVTWQAGTKDADGIRVPDHLALK